MSLVHHEVSDRQVAANQANAQKSTSSMRKSEPAKLESLFAAATSKMATRWQSPIPNKREAKGPTAEVASSAIAKTAEASDRAQPDRRNEPPKPECNLESTTCRIADVVGRPITKADRAGARPNGRNERPKTEDNLESMTSRIAHALGRPIAKAGGTGAGAQPDGRNEPPRPGSADLGCKSTVVRVKKSNRLGIWKPKLHALLLHAGLRCPRNRLL